MTDWSRSDTPRTVQFWAYWAASRFALAVGFYAIGWMPAFWFLLGSLWPEAAWYLRDERLKAMTRAIKPLHHTITRLKTENEALTSTVLAYKHRDGRRGSISSICINSSWGAH